MSKRVRVSVPLRGVGCFESLLCRSQKYKKFPSPCGVWVASFYPRVFDVTVRFRPLAGCGLFHTYEEPEAVLCVSVPLRGVGCFSIDQSSSGESDCFRPLAGCGLFHLGKSFRCRRNVSVPLRGVGCFSPRRGCARGAEVSVPLRGVGCFGKAAHSFWCNRKKNCQLCCFIVSYWQMFINSKLRNCKVPCEAHKTAT